MMCAATANWTLFTDMPSPAQYVMLKGTIGCKAWYRGLISHFLVLSLNTFFSVFTDAFVELNHRSTTQLILHGDFGVVSICLPEGRMLGICPLETCVSTQRCTRPSNTPVVIQCGKSDSKRPFFSGQQW